MVEFDPKEYPQTCTNKPGGCGAPAYTGGGKDCYCTNPECQYFDRENLTVPEPDKAAEADDRSLRTDLARAMREHIDQKITEGLSAPVSLKVGEVFRSPDELTERDGERWAPASVRIPRALAEHVAARLSIRHGIVSVDDIEQALKDFSHVRTRISTEKDTLYQSYRAEVSIAPEAQCRCPDYVREAAFHEIGKKLMTMLAEALRLSPSALLENRDRPYQVAATLLAPAHEERMRRMQQERRLEQRRRGDMVCLGCGKYSSAQTCWECCRP